MKSRFYVILAALLMLGQMAVAQKVDQRLTRLMKQNKEIAQTGRRAIAKDFKNSMEIQCNPDGSAKAVAVTAYLKQDAECPTKLLESKGVEIHRVIDNMVSMTVPVEKLSEFEAIDEFVLVNPTTVSRTFNMEAGLSSKASVANDAAKAIAAGLPQAYTGKGVVVGIIDTGIDYNHYAFRKGDGTTRIVKVLDYSTNSLDEFNDPSQFSTRGTDNYMESHGTHTAATAVGTELGNSLHGVATEADIILAGKGQTSSDESTVDAIERIFKYAENVGKPAVINISMGHINDLHDGSTIVCKAIKQYTENGTKPGRIVVMSAGNEASNRQSIIAKLGTADANGWQLKTVLGCNNVPTATELPIYVQMCLCLYASDGKEFTVQLKAVNIETGEVADANSQVVDDLNLGEGVTPEIEKTKKININGQQVVMYSLTDISTTKMKSKDWRLALFVKGTEGQTIKMARINDETNEWNFYIPEKLQNQGYTDGTPDIAFNADACDDAVISVGAYTTLTNWQDYNYNNKSYIPSKITGKEQEVGEIADFSSYCVDDNGKDRPTVIAPGQGLLSAVNLYDSNFFIGGVPNTELDLTFLLPDYMTVNQSDHNNWYGMMSGTSMSSPHTAGIVALWLQANPQLTEQQIVNIMKETSVKDDFVTDVTKIPSHNKVQAGCGKIDAVAGLKKILGTTNIETIGANGHREATPATMYDVDAPVFNMMGQRVDKSQKGLVIYKGRKYINK